MSDLVQDQRTADRLHKRLLTGLSTIFHNAVPVSLESDRLELLIEVRPEGRGQPWSVVGTRESNRLPEVRSGSLNRGLKVRSPDGQRADPTVHC